MMFNVDVVHFKWELSSNLIVLACEARSDLLKTPCHSVVKPKLVHTALNSILRDKPCTFLNQSDPRTSNSDCLHLLAEASSVGVSGERDIDGDEMTATIVIIFSIIVIILSFTRCWWSWR